MRPVQPHLTFGPQQPLFSLKSPIWKTKGLSAHSTKTALFIAIYSVLGHIGQAKHHCRCHMPLREPRRWPVVAAARIESAAGAPARQRDR